MRLAMLVCLGVIAYASLTGCASITKDEPAPLPQAPPRQPQEVRTPLPTAQKTPVPSNPGEARAPGQAQAPVSPQSRSALAGAYIQLDTGWSWAANAGMTNTTPQPAGANCLLQAFTVPPAHTCAGTLDSLGSSLVLGFGVGYRLPGGIRIDVTYDNRSGYNLSGTSLTGVNFDPKVTANTVLFNGYYDLPIKIGERVRPYIGGGIGWSKNKVNNINYSEPGPSPDSGQVPGGSKGGLAWQLTLGAEVRVTENWVLDIGYRYVDLGKIETSAGPATAGDPFNADNYTTPVQGKLRANELVFNFRYGF